MHMYEHELYHYGVKGMKWGVRKAREAYIKGLEIKRRSDKRKYTRDKIDVILKPGEPGKKHKEYRGLKRMYRAKDAKTAYRVAQQKAKLDPTYKNSGEYKSARIEYGKQKALEILQDLSNTTKKH